MQIGVGRHLVLQTPRVRERLGSSCARRLHCLAVGVCLVPHMIYDDEHAARFSTLESDRAQCATKMSLVVPTGMRCNDGHNRRVSLRSIGQAAEALDRHVLGL
jgi:hypothetical protein